MFYDAFGLQRLEMAGFGNLKTSFSPDAELVTEAPTPEHHDRVPESHKALGTFQRRRCSLRALRRVSVARHCVCGVVWRCP